MDRKNNMSYNVKLYNGMFYGENGRLYSVKWNNSNWLSLYNPVALGISDKTVVYTTFVDVFVNIDSIHKDGHPERAIFLTKEALYIPEWLRDKKILGYNRMWCPILENGYKKIAYKLELEEESFITTEKIQHVFDQLGSLDKPIIETENYLYVPNFCLLQ